MSRQCPLVAEGRLTGVRRPGSATGAVSLVALTLGVVLLAMSPHYGPHRDELYFASAGQRLAWGYPDQPAFTPLLARMATAIAPSNLMVLRLPSLLAVCALVVLSAAFARVLGGGRRAQVLTAVTVAASAITLTLGHRLSTATFDTLAWSAILLVVTRALVEDRPRLWLLAGLIAGVGLHNKHAVAIFLVAILVGVAAVRPTRGSLRTPYPWLAGCLALAMWAPNLLWQARSGWPVLELSEDIAGEYGGLLGRLGLVGQALAMFSPVIAVVWLLGLVALMRREEWVRARPVAVTFLTLAVMFLVTGGKGYYLAGAIPPLVAAGCTVLAERWQGARLAAAGAVLALSAMLAWPALVPVLPVSTYTASPFTDLDADQLETIGWPEYVADVRSSLAELPPVEREAAVVFTANYGEAGALEWYGVGVPVYSGHNGWGNWGPPRDDTGPVIVVGVDRPERAFVGCARTAVLTNSAGADNEESGASVWTCEGPRGSWAQQWPSLTHLDA
jgi:hypothetical protein